MEKICESTFHPSLAECEDWPHPRVDHRTGVMLAQLRALREWLLRRDWRSRHALGSRIPRLGRRVLVRVLRKSRPGRLWRYAQAGDLPGYGAQIHGSLLQEFVAANTGKNAIAFTHKPVLGDDPIAIDNRRLITAAVRAGFTVNLSADNPAHADRLAELGIAPSRPCLLERTRGAQSGTGLRDSATSGLRRLANGVTVRLHCRATRPPEDASRSAPRPTPTPLARLAAPAPGSGTL